MTAAVQMQNQKNQYRKDPMAGLPCAEATAICNKKLKDRDWRESKRALGANGKTAAGRLEAPRQGLA